MIDDASARLRQFMSAMKAWDLKFHPLLEAEAASNLNAARKEVGAIFDEYVADTADRVERKHSPHASRPPEYDPETQSITHEDVGATRAVLVTEAATGLKQTIRYTLVKQGSEWMLSTKDVLRRASDTWASHSI